MNFFDHQEQARRTTWQLALLFVLALAGIVLVVGVGVWLSVLKWTRPDYTLVQWLVSPGFAWCAGLTLTVIVAGTLRKVWQLRDGGEALAGMLHAREIPPDTRMTDERLLRNVVEEMAIASGIPAPRTFLLSREKAINAFVAGYRPTEAVVFVTQGLLDELSRDELQGVIAHEFSHILNADMRINMRLMSLLAGILAIGKVGEFLMEAHTHASWGERRRRDLRVSLLGLALILIGYVGLFFGRLIKAAISRQRERLADASAVQFTRNPAGLAGALMRIRNGPGSHLHSFHAEDMSHMCFGETMTFHWRRLLASHPTLDERLQALGSQWLARARVRARNVSQDESRTVAPLSASPNAFVATHEAESAAARRPARTSVRIGHLDQATMGYAAALLHAIPDDLRARVRHPHGAQLVVLALASADSHNPPQGPGYTSLNRIEQEELRHLAEQIRALGTRMRLPLIDLALPALKSLPTDERQALCNTLHTLVRADGRVSLFELLLTCMLDEHLKEHAGRATRVRFSRYASVSGDLQVLISLMIHASGARNSEADALFQRFSQGLLHPGRQLLPSKACTLAALERALARLRALTPLLKAPLIDALADLAQADGKVQVAEMELLRLTGELIDCPVPPLPAVVDVAARVAQ